MQTKGRYVLEIVEAEGERGNVVSALGRVFNEWEKMGRPSGEFMVEFAERQGDSYAEKGMSTVSSRGICPVKHENDLLRQRIAIATKMAKGYHDEFKSDASGRYIAIFNALSAPGSDIGNCRPTCSCNVT